MNLPMDEFRYSVYFRHRIDIRYNQMFLLVINCYFLLIFLRNPNSDFFRRFDLDSGLTDFFL